jgi:hypothetical protein
VALSANGGNYVEITDCLSFRQTEVEGFGDRILDKDLIAATIISIGSCSRLDPGFIPFMSRYIRSSDCQLLSHGLSAGTHVGGFGIQWLESCGSDRIDPIHVDNSWTFYYVHVTSGAWGKFAFPPSGWECTLRTSEEIAPEDGMQRQLVKVIELDLYGVGSLSVCLDADWPGLDDG